MTPDFADRIDEAWATLVGRNSQELRARLVGAAIVALVISAAVAGRITPGSFEQAVKRLHLGENSSLRGSVPVGWPFPAVGEANFGR